jgi:hypothetical protein
MIKEITSDKIKKKVMKMLREMTPDKLKDGMIEKMNMKEHLSAVSQFVSNYILLRLSLSLVKRKLKTLNYFLGVLDKSGASLSKIDINNDLFLEENIDYLKNLKNLEREEIPILIREIERRKDSLEDYEKYLRKKYDMN